MFASRPARYAGLILAAALAGIVTGAPPAGAATAVRATTVTIVHTTISMTGVPSHLPTGGTLSLTVTFTNKESRYRIFLHYLGFLVWNTCSCIDDAGHGTAATFRDPSTGQWRSAPSGGDGAYDFEIAHPIGVEPGASVSVPAKLSVAKFRAGTYRVYQTGAGTNGVVVALTGAEVTPFDVAITNTNPQRILTVGSTPAAPRHTTAPSTAGPRHTTPTPHATGRSPLPSVAPIATTGPSSPSPATPGDSAPPSVIVAVPAAHVGTRGSGAWTWLLSAALACAAGVTRHRRRVTRPPA